MLSESNSFMMEDQQMPPSSSSSSASSSPAPSSPLSPSHHTATFETSALLDEYGSSINPPKQNVESINTTTTLNTNSSSNIDIRSSNDDSLPPIASIPPNSTTARVVNVGPIMNAIQAYSGNNGNTDNNTNVRLSSASSSCSTISDHSMNNTMINGQASSKPLNDFENVFASFKKRNREQYENNNQSSSSSDPVSYIRDLEDKIDFMAQLVTIQSAKMRKMEMRLKKLENLLPQSGDEFVNSGNLHRLPHNVGSDELSSISDDIPTFSAPKKEKGNRQPNAYNIFMKGEIQRIRTTHTELTQKQAFKLAANNWTLKKSEILGASSNGSQKKPDDRTSTASTPSDTTMNDSLSVGTPASEEK